MATVLGLLLVVTFIASYLTTTLPNQMAINDLNHDTLVQNQVSQLAAVATQIASADAVGGQATFPVSLGSEGAPPFAGPDSSLLVPQPSHNYTAGFYALYANYSATSSAGTQSLSAAAVPGAGFVVELRNTYSSSAEVAYDEGAVIFAEPGGVPIMEDPPAITLSGTTLAIVEPVFTNALSSESGTATAEVALRLTAIQSVTLPVTGFALSANVVLTIYSPYAIAWVNYFESQTSFASATITCTALAFNVCSSSYAYQPGHGNGKVTMTIPVTSLTVTQAFFSVTVA